MGLGADRLRRAGLARLAEAAAADGGRVMQPFLVSALVIAIAGENKVTSLLILSQVILSFQLPFAVIPLIQFTGDRAQMCEFVNSRFTVVVGWAVAAAILFFNAELVWLIFRSK